MNNILLGIVIGISISTLNILILTRSSVSKTVIGEVLKIKNKILSKKATIVDIEPDVNLDEPIE